MASKSILERLRSPPNTSSNEPLAPLQGMEIAANPKMLYSSLLANPDDPQVHRPLHGPHGPLPGPREPGSPGRTAIVQGQVFIVGTMLIAQFWLVTDALFSLL